MTPELEDARPPATQDIRALTAALLAVISLLGTIAAILLGVDTAAIATLGGFTTTFGAYALGIQSETRE